MDESPNEELPLEKRRQIFKQELEILREKKLIPKTDYIRISNAYERHVQQVIQNENQASVGQKKGEGQVKNKLLIQTYKQEEETGSKRYRSLQGCSSACLRRKKFHQRRRSGKG